MKTKLLKERHVPHTSCRRRASCSGRGLPSGRPQLSASMSDSSVTVRTKKFITNRLLSRRQFVSNPQRPNASSALYAQMPAQPSDTLHSLRLASLPLQCVCCVCCVCSAPGGWLRHLSLPDAPTVLVIGWNGSMLTRARSRARPCRFAQVVEVIHPGLAGVSKKDLKEKLATMYKVRRYHGSGRLRAGSVGSSGGSSTRTSGSTRRQQLHRLRQWRQQSAAPSGLWPDARLLPLERDAPHQRRQWRHITNTSAPPAYCTAGAPQAAAAPAHHTRLTSRLSALRFVRSPTPAASSCTASRSLLAVAAARALA